MSKGFMSSAASKSSEGIMTNAEKHGRKIARVESEIAHAERVLEWQVSEGYEAQAEYSRQAIAKLQAKLAKLV